MAELKAFTIEGVVDILTESANHELRHLVENAETSTGSLNKFGSAVTKLAGPAVIGALGVAFAEAALEAAKMGNEIHDSTLNFLADTDASVAESKVFTDALEKMHASGTESIESIAGALTELHRTMGPLNEEVLGVAESVMAFAKVSKIEGSEAVKLLRLDVEGFGKDMKYAAEMADILAKAEDVSGVKASELGRQLGDNAFMFREFGMDAEKATAMLALFGKNQANGAALVKGMTAVMTMSEHASDEQQLKMHTLGVRFDELGKPIGGAKAVFDAIVKTLQNTSASTAETSAALELLGKRSGHEFEKGLRGGQKALEDMTKAIHDHKDAVKTDADLMDQRMSEAFTLLKRKLEPVQLMLGKMWADGAVAAVRDIGIIVDSVQKFGDWLGKKSLEIGDFWDVVLHGRQTHASTTTPGEDEGAGGTAHQHDLAMRENARKADLVRALLARKPGQEAYAVKGMDDKALLAQIGEGGTGTQEHIDIPTDTATYHKLRMPSRSELDAMHYGANTAVIPSNLSEAQFIPTAGKAKRVSEAKEIMDQANREIAVIEKKVKLEQLSERAAADQISAIKARTDVELKGAEDTNAVKTFNAALEIKNHDANLAATQKEIADEKRGIDELRAAHKSSDTDELQWIEKLLNSHILSKDEQESKELELAQLKGKIADANEKAEQSILGLIGTETEQRKESLRMQLRDLTEHGVDKDKIARFEATSNQRIKEDQFKSEQTLRGQIMQNDGEITASKLANLEIQKNDYMRTMQDKVLVEKWFNSQVQQLAEDSQRAQQQVYIDILHIAHMETEAKKRELELQYEAMKKSGIDEITIEKKKAADKYAIWEASRDANNAMINETLGLQGKNAQLAVRELQESVRKAQKANVSEETIAEFVEQKRLKILQDALEAQNKLDAARNKSVFTGGAMSVQEAFSGGAEGGKSMGLGTSGIFSGDQQAEAAFNQTTEDLSADQINKSIDALGAGKAGMSVEQNARMINFQDQEEKAKMDAVTSNLPNMNTFGSNLGSVAAGLAGDQTTAATATQTNVPGQKVSQQPMDISQRVSITLDVNGTVKVSGDKLSETTVQGIASDLGITGRRLGDAMDARNGRSQ